MIRLLVHLRQHRSLSLVASCAPAVMFAIVSVFVLTACVAANRSCSTRRTGCRSTSKNLRFAPTVTPLPTRLFAGRSLSPYRVSQATRLIVVRTLSISCWPDCTMKRHHTHSVCEPWATSIDQCATRPTRFCHLHYRDGQFLLDDHLPPESLQTSVNLGTNTDRDRHTAAGDRQLGTGPLPSLRTVVCLIFLSGYGVGPPPQIVVDSQQHEPPSIQVALATGYCAGWKATRLVSIFHSATSCDESGGCRSHAPAVPGSGIPTSGISVCFTSLEARAHSESSCWPGPASQWRTPPESGCV